MKHKHSEVLHAFADGIECEYWSSCDTWIPFNDISVFNWVDDVRIKPEPKPDVVLATNIGISEGYVDCSSLLKKNIKLTFCGETGDLKNAEVIK
jgi:hypothetical protein